MSWWESVYKHSPPWDIGAPQPEIVKLVKSNEIKVGRVLDIGCGVGDNSIFLAKRGFSVTCLDIAQLAIEKGKRKAKEQKIKVNFLVGNALKLDEYFKKASFDIVIDSGLFHTLDDDERSLYAKQIKRVLVRGGSIFMLCFSDKEPGSEGPRRISRKEIEETLAGIFVINYIRDTFFASKRHKEGAKAYMVSMTKTEDA
ncbi:MAG: class I SAM-dependent methyltransferase [Candidatus Bathyarchaeota archaeon]|nr:class I SAM-dependent methyltransferase [Candidatus Bathyarchaeota archaeon]